jgi:hypothetical protein
MSLATRNPQFRYALAILVLPLVAAPMLPSSGQSQAVPEPLAVSAEAAAEVPAVIVNQVGSHTKSGCQFTMRGTGRATGDPKLEVTDEIDYDAESCTRTYSKTVYSATSGPGWAKAVLQQVSGDSAATTLAAIPSKTYRGALYATLKDPVALTVTETDAVLEWTATSSSVKSYSGSGKWSWLTATGWKKTGGSVSQGRTNSSVVWTNTTGRFSNGVFCKVLLGGFGATTYADHAKTRFEGKSGGGYAWSATVNKSGGCAGMLHVKTYLIKP